MAVKFVVQTILLFVLAAAPTVSFAPGGRSVVRGPQTQTDRNSKLTTTSLAPTDILASLGISEELLLPLAAGAVAVLGIGAVAAGGDGDGGGSNASFSSSGGKTDVKVDYDAAIQFNYLEETPPGTRSIPGYEKYKVLYKEKSVAEVKIKALQRQVNALNQEIAEITNPSP